MMAVKLTPVDSVKIGVIGFGNEGCRIVRSLGFDPEWDVSVALWDSCHSSLRRLDAPESIVQNLGVNITHGMGCMGQIDLGRSVFLDEQEYCRQWIQDKDIVLVAGALGGGFTGGFFPEFAKIGKVANTPVLAYALMPFSFEGRKRVDGSRQVLNNLRETCIAVVSLEGDDYLDAIDESALAEPALEAMRDECVRAMGAMVTMLMEKGLYEFNLATLRSAFDLDVAKTLVISAESGSEPDGVESVIESLIQRLDSKFPDRELRIDRLLISVIGGRNLTAAAVNQINRSVSERFSQPGKTFFGACIQQGLEKIRIIVYLSIHLGKQFEWVHLSNEQSLSNQAVNRHSRKSAKKKDKARKPGGKAKDDEEEPQSFFDSILNESNRGYFDDTPANSWNGIDLDVPTYIRRGIRVK